MAVEQPTNQEVYSYYARERVGSPFSPADLEEDQYRKMIEKDGEDFEVWKEKYIKSREEQGRKQAEALFTATSFWEGLKINIEKPVESELVLKKGFSFGTKDIWEKLGEALKGQFELTEVFSGVLDEELKVFGDDAEEFKVAALDVAPAFYAQHLISSIEKKFDAKWPSLVAMLEDQTKNYGVDYSFSIKDGKIVDLKFVETDEFKKDYEAYDNKENLERAEKLKKEGNEKKVEAVLKHPLFGALFSIVGLPDPKSYVRSIVDGTNKGAGFWMLVMGFAGVEGVGLGAVDKLGAVLPGKAGKAVKSFTESMKKMTSKFVEVLSGEAEMGKSLENFVKGIEAENGEEYVVSGGGVELVNGMSFSGDYMKYGKLKIVVPEGKGVVDFGLNLKGERVLDADGNSVDSAVVKTLSSPGVYYVDVNPGADLFELPKGTKFGEGVKLSLEV
ncbi:hypothetical protein KJ632_05655 [Patescibacteria group bacterium]|nr:hypothetical protein [Patescibacteria group bacterium]